MSGPWQRLRRARPTGTVLRKVHRPQLVGSTQVPGYGESPVSGTAVVAERWVLVIGAGRREVVANVSEQVWDRYQVGDQVREIDLRPWTR
jgi:hypothetical protein